ncbi:hypothetical protein [Actinoplanes sp. G11-F43]|uniref:hypothetical protein n=1 Tax=Actinoplanes sp. G11-F43 TaxID=3424130 RepID=UPI003D32D28F
MHRNPLLTVIVYLHTGLQARVTELRRDPERGSHATEYAIGIGAGAAIVLGLYAAYKTGVAQIIERWVFQ